VSLEFLSPLIAGAPAARSPMERDARAAGARFEVRDGWNVAVGYRSPADERAACRHRAAWADVSHLGKLELQGPREELSRLAGAPLELGRATAAAGARWCPLTAERVLVLCPSDATGALRERAGDEAEVAAVDVTSTFAALTVLGPLAREVLARLTALDLRPAVTPPGAFRPGSVARVPGMVLHEAEDRFVVLFGAALGHYMWTAVADAAERLGGAPVGVDALERDRA
jgi:heterotetrameric sarcosine oxidase gamma subunit